MPLHALRHTAAASWLTTGHSLIFVARQLGHRSITTTEQHYGHLELNLFNTALQATDDAISRAGDRPACGLIGAARRKCVPGLLGLSLEDGEVAGGVLWTPISRGLTVG